VQQIPSKSVSDSDERESKLDPEPEDDPPRAFWRLLLRDETGARTLGAPDMYGY